MEKYNKTKYEYLYENNKDYMNYNALTFGNRIITFEEMHYKIEEYKNLLYSKGVRKGDIIGICAFNTPEAVYLLYALDRLGATVVGFNPVDSFENTEKIKSQIELIKPKMIVSVDVCFKSFKNLENRLNFSTVLYSPMESINDKIERLKYRLAQLKTKSLITSKDSNLLLAEIDSLEAKIAEYKEDRISDILFTGGTTGTPKGAMQTARGLNSLVEGMNSIFTPEPGMIHLGNIPIAHMAYGQSLLHYALCNNMTFALTLKGLPKDFYPELKRTEANAAAGGPPHWNELIEKKGNIYVTSGKVTPGSLSALCYATSGGEAKKDTLTKAINEALRYAGSSAVLGDGLGLTENFGPAIINNGRTYGQNTIGKPISTLNTKLINPETHKEVQDGEEGELWISGPSVMKGYYNDPEETAKVTKYDKETGEVWLNTGDVLIKKDGVYTYAGRTKRLFVSGIDDIYPEQLENRLLEIPEIKEAVVTSIPDDLKQNIPIYHLFLHDGEIDHQILEAKINKLVLKYFNENWLPGSIDYHSNLYYTPNLKVNIKYYQNQGRQNEERKIG